MPAWPHGHPVPRPPGRRADARGQRSGAVLHALRRPDAHRLHACNCPSCHGAASRRAVRNRQRRRHDQGHDRRRGAGREGHADQHANRRHRTSAPADANGNYEFFTVRIGTYVVTAEKDGFSIALVDNVQVTVGARQRVDLVDGGRAADARRCEVSASAVLLQTDSSDRSQVITGEQTRALPLNGREYSALALLSPGVRLSALNTGGFTPREGSFNVNGLRSHLQQLPDRRRRQQRLRHQQPGLLEPGDAAVAGRGRRVQGRHQQHERRVRPLRRRDDQRRVRERHQPVPRLGLGVRAPHRAQRDRRLPSGRRRQAGIRSRPVRRRARRPDRARTARSSSPTSRASSRRASQTAISTIPTLAQRQGILAVDVRNPLTGDDLPGRHADPDDARSRARC